MQEFIKKYGISNFFSDGLESFMEKNFTGGPSKAQKSLKIHIFRYWILRENGFLVPQIKKQ